MHVLIARNKVDSGLMQRRIGFATSPSFSYYKQSAKCLDYLNCRRLNDPPVMQLKFAHQCDDQIVYALVELR